MESKPPLSVRNLKENKMIKGYKTVLFGLALALISIFSNEEMVLFISENVPVLGTFIGTIVIVLRALTSSAVFKK